MSAAIKSGYLLPSRSSEGGGFGGPLLLTEGVPTKAGELQYLAGIGLLT